ncbi:MAG: hypothetical protein ACYC8T_16975, partial [Myxococcaceae bacterium]
MRRLLLLLALAGCPSPAPPPPSPCPEGMRQVGDSAFCEPIPPVCGPGTAELVPGDGCVAVGWTSCPPGFLAAASGWGCEPVLPSAPCAAGTMPVIGAATCQPVGWSHCGEGFTADPSGWGCAPVLPATACAGSTFEVLGQASCQPLGDCAAAFPPAAATLFVDDSYLAGQLDATHFNSIGAALAAAPAGATVAVEAGSYPEGLAFARAVKLIGRCAAQVTLSGTPAGPGLDVSGVKGVEVEGLGVTGFDLGAYADGAGSLELRRCRLEGNGRTGAQAMGAGTVLRLSGSVVRGTLPDSSGRFGIGVAATGGARLELTGSAVVENAEMGVFVTGAGTFAQLAGTLVRGTRARSNGRYGWGLAAQGAAGLSASGSLVQGNRAAGVVVGETSKAVLTQSMVTGTLPGFDNLGTPQAANAAVMPGGELELTGCALLDGIDQLKVKSSPTATSKVTLTDVLVRAGRDTPEAEAVRVDSGSILTATRTAVVDNHGNGLHVYGFSTVTLTDVLVQGTKVTSAVPSGYGLAISQAVVNATRLAVVDNAGAAVHLSVSASGTFERSIFERTRAAPVGGGAVYGLGIFVGTQAQADVNDSLIAANTGGGLVALGAGTTARLRGTLIRATGLDPEGDGQGVVAQGGAMVLLDGVGVVGNRTAGMQASDPGSLIKAFNVLVQGTLPGLAGNRGRGVNVQGGAQLELSDSALVENRQVGLFVWGAGTRAVLTGVLIDATAADADGRFGNGAEVLEGARADLRGSALRRSAGIALAVAGAAATVRDGKIEGNAVGIHAQDGSEVKEVDAIFEPVGATEVL